MYTEEDWQLFLHYCLTHCTRMFREPEGALRHPYLDPSGPYSKNLWDWDSLWAATAVLGISERCSAPELKAKTLRHLRGSIANFMEHQAEDGSIPIMLTPDNPDFFGSTRSNQENMAKPVLGQMCELLNAHEAFTNTELTTIVEKLARFYRCYRQRYQNQATGLYTWANDVAIGVDDDPATWGRPDFSSASIFLNCLLYQDLCAALQLAEAAAEVPLAVELREQRHELTVAIEKYCLDQRDGLYYSVDVLCRQNLRTHPQLGELNRNLTPFWNCLPVKVACWVSFMPLWCGIAEQTFARRMVQEHLLDRGRFWTDYGVRSLSASEKMYSPEEPRGNPSNWLGPVWIISNYMVWTGLNRYGFHKEAVTLADNMITLLIRDLRENGELHEYYSPESGKGLMGSGFLNWNLLACLMKPSGALLSCVEEENRPQQVSAT